MARQRWRPTPRIVPVATPAAGADWSITNNAGGGWLVRSVYGELTASAAVANREPNIRATDGSNVYFRVPLGVAQTAGTTVPYCAFAGATAGPAASTSRLFGWPSDGLWLRPGHALQAVTALIDVADQWANVILDVIEFPEVAPEFLLPFPYLYTVDSEE